MNTWDVINNRDFIFSYLEPSILYLKICTLLLIVYSLFIIKMLLFPRLQQSKKSL